MSDEELRPGDLEDLRAAMRYRVDARLPSSFGATAVEIVDLSARGVQMRHRESIRLGSEGRFAISLSPTERIAVRAVIVWSHLSQRALKAGLPPYSTGARFDEADAPVAASLVEQLVDRSLATPVEHSMGEKRRKLQQKDRDRRQGMTPRGVFVSAISTDQLLMINHARERLRTNPDEAKKWYQRARYALKEDESRGTGAPKHYREDILAVWEYLERSIDIATIARVFEQHLK